MTIITGFAACDKPKETQKSGFRIASLRQSSLLKKTKIDLSEIEKVKAAATIIIDTSKSFQKNDGVGYSGKGYKSKKASFQ